MSVADQLRLEDVTIGVLTALPKEYAAVCEALNCLPEIHYPGNGAGRRYALAKVRSCDGGTHIVAVALLADMGNNSAAIRASQMIQHCNPRLIIMCGIAGAVPHPAKPADHVRLGDLVVSDRNGVVQYDFDKELLGSSSALAGEVIKDSRHPPRPPAAELLEAVRSLEAKRLRSEYPWEPHIKRVTTKLGGNWARPPEDRDQLRDWDDSNLAVPHPTQGERRESTPHLFYGTIASANKLLKNPILRNALRDRFGVKAVEMEGSGIADAAWSHGIGYLVIRGTCDYCNPDKGDDWQPHASIIAACYTLCVIEATATVSGTSAAHAHSPSDGVLDESYRKLIECVVEDNKLFRSELADRRQPVTDVPGNNARHESPHNLSPKTAVSSDLSPPDMLSPEKTEELKDQVRKGIADNATVERLDLQGKLFLDELRRLLANLEIERAASLVSQEVDGWLNRNAQNLETKLAFQLFRELAEVKLRHAKLLRSEVERRAHLDKAELYLEKAKQYVD